MAGRVHIAHLLCPQSPGRPVFAVGESICWGCSGRWARNGTPGCDRLYPSPVMATGCVKFPEMRLVTESRGPSGQPLPNTATSNCMLGVCTLKLGTVLWVYCVCLGQSRPRKKKGSMCPSPPITPTSDTNTVPVLVNSTRIYFGGGYSECCLVGGGSSRGDDRWGRWRWTPLLWVCQQRRHDPE